VILVLILAGIGFVGFGICRRFAYDDKNAVFQTDRLVRKPEILESFELHEINARQAHHGGNARRGHGEWQIRLHSYSFGTLPDPFVIPNGRIEKNDEINHGVMTGFKK